MIKVVCRVFVLLLFFSCKLRYFFYILATLWVCVLPDFINFIHTNLIRDFCTEPIVLIHVNLYFMVKHITVIFMKKKFNIQYGPFSLKIDTLYSTKY